MSYYESIVIIAVMFFIFLIFIVAKA